MDKMDSDRLLIVQARARYATHILNMVAAGIHIFMAFYGLSVFLETPKHMRKGRKRYIATSFVITCLVTFGASLDMARYFQVLFQSTSPSHWQGLARLSDSGWQAMLSHTGGWILVWIGDILLVYRCFVVCVDYSWVAAFPAATSVSALVLGLISTYGHNSVHGRRYGIANALLTISTNVTVTMLITFRILRARRTLAKMLPLDNIRLYTGVVAILIESALPPSIFGIVAAALLLTAEPLSMDAPPSEGLVICFHLFSGLYAISCSLAPHMIIFRVTIGRSFTKFPATKSGNLPRPIQFTQRTAASSFLQSSASSHQIDRTAEPDIEQLGQDPSGEIQIAETAQIDSCNVVSRAALTRTPE